MIRIFHLPPITLSDSPMGQGETQGHTPLQAMVSVFLLILSLLVNSNNPDRLGSFGIISHIFFRVNMNFIPT
jgi:hypothetical protein